MDLIDIAQNILRDCMGAKQGEEVLIVTDDSRVNICLLYTSADAAERYGVAGNYVAGANIAGFEKVVEAMLGQGIV